MGSRVLVDTNLVIDLLRDVPQATPELQRHQDRAISIVTWIEVLSGLREQEAAVKEGLKTNFPVLPLSPEIAEEAALLRRTTRLKLPDAIILATAHVEKRVLLTRNSRDFSEGRFVHIPYQL